MDFYKLRVTIPWSRSSEIISLIDQHSSTYCYCFEDAENEHLHFYFETNSKNPTIRNHIKKLGLIGNKSYSLKKADEQYPMEYLAYVYKQNDFYNVGMPEDIVSRALDHDSKVKESMRARRADKKTIVKQLIDLIEADRTQYFDFGKICPQSVMLLIIDYYRTNDMLVRRFQMQAYYDTIILHYSSDSEMMYLFH